MIHANEAYTQTMIIRNNAVDKYLSKLINQAVAEGKLAVDVNISDIIDTIPCIECDYKERITAILKKYGYGYRFYDTEIGQINALIIGWVCELC